MKNSLETRGCFRSTEGRYKTNIPKEIKRNKKNGNQGVTNQCCFLCMPIFSFVPSFFAPYLRPDENKVVPLQTKGNKE